MKVLQVDSIKGEIDELQKKHGHKDFCALYGTGCIKRPKVMFLFMNPTAKNLTVKKEWKGIRAPWVGLKNTWRLMHKLNVISDKTIALIESMDEEDWTDEFVVKLYSEVSSSGAYLTNLARSTQPDARHISDTIFRESRKVTLEEISIIRPRMIIAFGNQVSTTLLGQSIKVSECRRKKFELEIGKYSYDVYPTYYPVGMGIMNMAKAVSDIKYIVSKY